jgi:hypothetical protein
MSEMSRTAKALVTSHSEKFAFELPPEVARERVTQALAALGPLQATVLEVAWDATSVETRFSPTRSTLRMLRVLSIGMALAVAASAWTILREEGAVAFLMPLFTVLATLAIPFVALGLGSRRAAEESRVTRAVRVALGEEMPWKKLRDDA